MKPQIEDKATITVQEALHHYSMKRSLAQPHLSIPKPVRLNMT